MHLAPPLQQRIRIVATASGPAGQFDPDSWRMLLSAADRTPHLTLAHEIGHVLDRCAFVPAAPGFASRSGWAALARWDTAVRHSNAYRTLRRELEQATTRVRVAILLDFLDPAELWARSYAQYIATRSGQSGEHIGVDLARIIESDRRSHRPPEHWDDVDFAPIAGAIDDLLRQMQWLR